MVKLPSEIIIKPPIKIEPSSVYLLVIKDASGIVHYFNHDGSYDGSSKDTYPIERIPN